MNIGIIGSGAMGSGIAQVAAMAGHSVTIIDTNQQALDKSKSSTTTLLHKLQEKGKVQNADTILSHMQWTSDYQSLSACSLVIEAIIENLSVKQEVFRKVEQLVTQDCILASNTSSLSITSIAAACQQPERVIGLHFFNPATLMPLVEIIPAIQTKEGLADEMLSLMKSWVKLPVIAKDTPGFIVNRVARPYYGEAMRILEEGRYTMMDIDMAMTQYAHFKMGPFTLMDYIGHDVNYVVTETVFQSFYYDPRYKPSLSQKRLLEAGWLGRKSGRGFYNYADGEVSLTTSITEDAQRAIAERIVAMLINEAVDALFLNIATVPDLETAMTRGVNYPKGLLQWCDDLGAGFVLGILDSLYDRYHEDRYRASPLLRQYAITNQRFLS